MSVTQYRLQDWEEQYHNGIVNPNAAVCERWSYDRRRKSLPRIWITILNIHVYLFALHCLENTKTHISIPHDGRCWWDSKLLPSACESPALPLWYIKITNDTNVHLENQLLIIAKIPDFPIRHCLLFILDCSLLYIPLSPSLCITVQYYS